MIRKATKNDIPKLNCLLTQVLELHATARPDIFKRGTKKYTDTELESIIHNDNSPIFVYIDENDLVHGYAFCQIHNIFDDNILQDIRYLYVDDLCVDTLDRGKHIGSMLYDYVKTFSKENGCKQIRLNVWNFNKGAIAFYEKLGFSSLKITMEQNV